jgi:hypothetical protein
MLLGKPFLESEVVDGMFIVKDRHITFTDEDDPVPLKINILTLATTCINPEPCMCETFVMQMSKKLSGLKYATMTKSI